MVLSKKKKKVFSIGLHKTGTTSLSKALNILGVVATETINEDMLDHFNINITSHEKKNKKNIKLSEKSRKNIVKYLKSDYTVIENLFKHNLISENNIYFFQKLL